MTSLVDPLNRIVTVRCIEECIKLAECRFEAPLHLRALFVRFRWILSGSRCLLLLEERRDLRALFEVFLGESPPTPPN